LNKSDLERMTQQPTKNMEAADRARIAASKRVVIV